MSDEEPTRRLAAILAADVVGYTRLVEGDESGTLAAWRALQARLIEQAVALHRGRIFKMTGDGFLAIFDSAVNAAACAVKIQKAVADDQAGVEQARRIAASISAMSTCRTTMCWATASSLPAASRQPPTRVACWSRKRLPMRSAAVSTSGSWMPANLR